ncbi:hypothetical protein H6F32_18525 [Anabaena sp. FACHB-1237]|uniref:hypothetical protein n=1 Tax=Anabaena sp. FACHB-1237 TaxID=2692769 RepID=UPI001680F8E5|nr:hypothetical protein [Anabaena sp. FACHB-1237]MBD2139509.1 hypothetical protein [Anabaena sp. FACHB-1237]
MTTIILKNTEYGWIFTEEKLLQDFICENLENSLDITHIPHPQLSQIKKAIEVVHNN